MAAIFWGNLIIKKIWIVNTALIAVGIVSTVNMVWYKKDFEENKRGQWKEMAQYIIENNTKPVFTEHQLYLNYYLNYLSSDIEAENSQQIPKELNQVLWIAKTVYDSENAVETNNLKVLNENNFANGFVVLKVEK